MLKKNKLNLVLVILMVLLAAGYLVFSTYIDAKKNQDDTTDVIRDQQDRRAILATMLRAALNRSLILQKMAAEEDAFELDDLNQAFAKQARLFIIARTKLLTLDLTDREKVLLDRHAALVRVNTSRQNKVAELFLSENREEAMKLLFEKALPAQNKIHEQISLLMDEYNQGSVASVKKMDHKFLENILAYLFLGGLLLVTSTIVIFYMLMRVSRNEEQQIKQAQNELAEQKFALDQHAIVSVTDVAGKITYVNDLLCKITGYTREELIGQDHRLLNSGDKDSAYWKNMYDVVSSGNVWSDIIRNKAKDGSFYWVDSTIFPLLGNDNKPRSYISIRTDITERKQAEEALRRAQKMEAFGQLTGGIAHDFNNILNVILGNLELLEIIVPKDEKIEKRINNIKKSVQRATDITRQLLDFSRSKASGAINVDLSLLIEKMDDIVAFSLTPQVEIEWCLATDLWPVKISSGDFEDAFLNVIINAKDAMSGSGKLKIETKNIYLDVNCCDIKEDVREGDYVHLMVSDSGEGMTPNQMDKIFEPFYTTKEQGKGTGLGLAMVFGFIQRSKGYVHVESEKGEGTIFNFYLPRATADVTSIDINSASEKSEKEMLPFGKESILLVDDEEALRILSEEMLVELGYQVQTAENGVQALDLLSKGEPFDLLITDVIMPGGLNGYELAEKAAAQNPELKVLIISGFTENIATNENQKRFTTNLLSKPYTQIELAQKVRTELMTH